MKKGSKTISRKSSKLWSKAKSLVKNSDKIPSDDPKVSNSPYSLVEALPVQLDDGEKMRAIEISEDDNDQFLLTL